MAKVSAELEWSNLDEALAGVEKELTDVARGISCELWNTVLDRTPQFYGHLVASWRYTLNTPTFVASDYMGSDRLDNAGGPDVEPVFRGHPRAIQVAVDASRGVDKRFRLGDTIWMANGADHGEGSYSARVESYEPEQLRERNRPGHAVQVSLSLVTLKLTNNTPAAAWKSVQMGAR